MRPHQEEQAKAIRAERDRLYRNIYAEATTDARWVGDLGEILFNDWLCHEGMTDFSWIQDEAAGKPDFVLGNQQRVGVKTVKRQVPPKMGYTAQITAKHAAEEVDHFFFLTYDLPQKRMWLLGGLSREGFLNHATYYGPGQWVHPNYQIRRGHEIYNAPISKLLRPAQWLAPHRGV